MRIFWESFDQPPVFNWIYRIRTESLLRNRSSHLVLCISCRYHDDHSVSLAAREMHAHHRGLSLLSRSVDSARARSYAILGTCHVGCAPPDLAARAATRLAHAPAEPVSLTQRIFTPLWRCGFVLLYTLRVTQMYTLNPIHELPHSLLGFQQKSHPALPDPVLRPTGVKKIAFFSWL